PRPARTRDLAGATGAADATAAPRQGAADAAAHGQPGAPRAGIATGSLRFVTLSGEAGNYEVVMKAHHCHVLGIEHPILAAPMGPDRRLTCYSGSGRETEASEALTRL